MRDEDGNITFDSDAVQKLILNLADSPSISFGSGVLFPHKLKIPLWY